MTCTAVLTGTANPSPSLPPDCVLICSLIPMTLPRESNSGPPELPGLMAASVWMPPVIVLPFGDCISRSVAETTPVVSVKSSPSGLPMATTCSPTLTAEESPIRTGRSSPVWLVSTLMRATSVDSSAPTTVPCTLDCWSPLDLNTTSTALTA